MRRRQYLSAAVAGAVGFSGCSSIEGLGDDDSAEPTPTSTSTPTATTAEPDIEIIDVSAGDERFIQGSDVTLTLEVGNSGGDGSVPVEVVVGDDAGYEGSMRVEGSRDVEEIELSDVPNGYYEYTITVQDDTVTGSFTVGTPVEQPRVVTSHTVLRQEQNNTAGAGRLTVHVQVKGDPDRGIAPPGREKLLNICRKLVIEELEERYWDVLRFGIWRETQTVGEEDPHATITWGANGNWSVENPGATGDYSAHEFDVAGAPYLVTDGVEEIRTDPWDFRVEFDIVNQGLHRETFQGGVSTPTTDEFRFEIELDPGERRNVWYERVYDGVLDRTEYTIDAYGSVPIYGKTSEYIMFN